MTPEKRKTTIAWLKEEIRSLHLAPKINGCGPENWADLLEIMETCLEAVRDYQPANIDREAWEPCEECKKRNCDNCKYSEYLSCIEPCRICENKSEWKPDNEFCGNCGRPLTEEACAMLEKRLRG